ncbi:MAG TPA: PHP domain-containing protein [Anaerolineaceae bacterium]|nr:PHP domain-containing protein [Anaerolineaceae bacterium]
MSLADKKIRISPYAAIDLHLHTSFSDGRWDPEILLDFLIKEHISLAAITDHDRVDIVASILALAEKKQIHIIPAVEMTSTWKGEMVDLLCYGFDPDNNYLRDLADDLRKRQQENTMEVVENLEKQGFNFTHDSITWLLSKPSCHQPHSLVDLLKDHGYGLGEPSAGKLIMEAGCQFQTNDPVMIVEAAHQSGAVCLLAHPGRGNGFFKYVPDSLNEFRLEVSIDGLEVFYPLHTSDQRAVFLEYAQHHRLLVSAGSDSHGLDKPPIKYNAELCRELLERLGWQLDTIN